MTRLFTALTLALLLGLAAGCSTESDLGGVRIPNARPDTDITGQPPSLLEAGFVCEFNWNGSDADGKVVGFEWKISDNGTDGISARDTMTFDPISGAEVNPWRYTTANDSIFYVLADQPGYPGDPELDARSFRTHTIFVRAVDEKGAVDPSPAHISFTSTTLLPTCRVTFPQLGGRSAKSVPRTLNIGWEGEDPDFDLPPTKARFLWIDAVTPDGGVIQIKSVYEQWKDELIDFYDPRWSEWIDYKDTEEERRAQFKGLNGLETYLFAVQVQDTAGAVSIGKDYQIQVANLKVSETAFAPSVELKEVYLGQALNTSPRNQIAAGQPLNFSWTADASSYNGNIVSYQHGWNVTNLDDVTDPGWSIGPGLSEQNKIAEQRSFTAGGLNYFYLKVTDDSERVVLYKWTLDVVPFVPPNEQDPLLVIDQVVDDNTGKWLDRLNNPRDSEEYRNLYWQFLEGNDGVADFSWESDHFDHGSAAYVTYASIVGYKAVLIFARMHTSQAMLADFRARNNVDPFVYLTPYQQQGGNLFLVGESSLDSFIEVAKYYVPIVFDTREAPLNGYLTSFGWKELPDGTLVERGPLMYHYATAGISSLDWTATGRKRIYARTNTVDTDRNARCVGLKALSLDPAFKGQHLIGPGALADTISANLVIDWQDTEALQNGTLDLGTTFQFTEDEFVNANISGTRTTPIIEQQCELGPNGLCIEPMYRGIARYDWIREIRWSQGETNWPYSRYSHVELMDDYCGPLALSALDTIQDGRARTNGRTFGYLSYKTVEDKPSGKADVYWGFDPYRFDEEDTQQAILWVLEYFGLELK